MIRTSLNHFSELSTAVILIFPLIVSAQTTSELEAAKKSADQFMIEFGLIANSGKLSGHDNFVKSFFEGNLITSDTKDQLRSDFIYVSKNQSQPLLWFKDLVIQERFKGARFEAQFNIEPKYYCVTKESLIKHVGKDLSLLVPMHGFQIFPTYSTGHIKIENGTRTINAQFSNLCATQISVLEFRLIN
jgi:hypothetical protein